MTTEPTCEPMRARMRPLAPEQVDRTLAPLLSSDLVPSEGFRDSLQLGSRFDGAAGTLGMSTPHVDDLLSTMESLSTEVVDTVAAEIGCDPALDCDAGFVASLIEHLFRRPATDDELDRYSQWVSFQQEEFAPAVSLEMLAEVLLMSPHSLYRSEIGEQGVLTDFEIASAISYLITDAPPDALLWQAAEDGVLSDPAERARHAERLLSTPESSSGLRRFFEEYLHASDVLTVSRDATVFPEFTETIRHDMVEEHRRYVEHVIWDDGGTFEALLTRPYTFLSPELAEFYGYPAPSEPWGQVDLSDGRVGALLQGTHMTLAGHDTSTSVVLRSVDFQSEFQCRALPEPPADVDDDLPVQFVDGPSTQRQRLDAHRQAPACMGCHNLIDPVGYPFESFDAVGRFRTSEQGLPIDTSGEVRVDAGTVEVASARELVEVVATDPAAQQCFVSNLALFADGEARDVLCQSADGSGDIRDMLVRHVESDSFIQRIAQDER